MNALARPPNATRTLGSALACLLVALAAVAAHAEDSAPCGPFEAGPTGIVELAADRTLSDPGIQATSSGSAVRDLARRSGSRIPEAPDPRRVRPGFARERGLSRSPTRPARFRRISSGPGRPDRPALFSPVICATVARVTDRPVDLDQLVTVVPETARRPERRPRERRRRAEADRRRHGCGRSLRPLQYGLRSRCARHGISAQARVCASRFSIPRRSSATATRAGSYRSHATETKGKASVHGR
jgi:hypothetical protein